MVKAEGVSINVGVVGSVWIVWAYADNADDQMAFDSVWSTEAKAKAYADEEMPKTGFRIQRFEVDGGQYEW